MITHKTFGLLSGFSSLAGEHDWHASIAKPNAINIAARKLLILI